MVEVCLCIQYYNGFKVKFNNIDFPFVTQPTIKVEGKEEKKISNARYNFLQELSSRQTIMEAGQHLNIGKINGTHIPLPLFSRKNPKKVPGLFVDTQKYVCRQVQMQAGSSVLSISLYICRCMYVSNFSTAISFHGCHLIAPVSCNQTSATFFVFILTMDFVQEKKKGSESRTLKAGLATSMIVPSKSNLAKSKKKRQTLRFIHPSAQIMKVFFLSFFSSLPTCHLINCQVARLMVWLKLMSIALERRKKKRRQRKSTRGAKKSE